MIKKGTRYLALIAVTFFLAAVLLFAGRDDFGLGRNMELAVNMMRELSLHYVDQVEPDKLMAGAAAGMVDDLDPYTEYMSEADMSNFELMTTGKYGGIGSLIRKKGDYITIAQPYKGTPADLAGLKIGDKIIAIDGKEAKGFSIEEVSKRLKGDPNTIVKLTVERLIGGARETFSLKRERIAIPGIPYAGFVADGIGYVQHSDFTEGCYEDMRARIEQLRAQGNLKGLILDYRNNGGGILQEAVKILSMFVPKGTEVVVTKDGKIRRCSARRQSLFCRIYP
ncbi:MAG: S41 family peptidase [Alistipes sp.]